MINIPYSGEEALKIAIVVEENGRKFHEQMASETEDEELSRLFKDLADEKAKHKETFESMLGETKVERGEDLNKKLYGKLEDTYLEALADSRVFTPANEKVQAAKQASNRNELISGAISLEKDTMLFFYEILDKARNSEDRELIDKVIEEEKKHIKRFIQLR